MAEHTTSGPGAGAVALHNPFARPVVPITERDDELRALLTDVELPPLLPALAQLTGDVSLLEDGLRPDPLLVSLPQGGLDEAQQRRIVDRAATALGAYRDAGGVPGPPPSDEQLLGFMEFAVGGVAMREYLPLLREELALDGEDRRAPGWTKATLAPDLEFEVAIIGAGMSGLLAAHRLQQAGVPFVILEKDHALGGTWLENTYPGCRVDNPNHNYSYSFAQRRDWPFHFSTQPVLLEYLDTCADAFDLRRHICFDTEVTSTTWSDADARWVLTTREPDGTTRTRTAHAVISAVGQLNRPLLPDIEGRDDFAGPSFHSARWDHQVDLRGRTVAVIGTGASAVQFVPELAERVAELLVFQRTPPWLAPTPDYHDPVSPGQRWLYDHLPGYSEWNRFWIFWKMGDAMLDAVRADPAWAGEDGSVSATNSFLQLMLGDYLRTELAGRPDLLAASLPRYPPGAKRLLRDNGIWPRTLQRDNVRLIDTPITAIAADGVRTADGEHHAVDVIVYGTGFQASRFLTPMTVTGRGGLDLHAHWDGEPRAYLGVTVPGFPNFFCLYGPNTNIVINGSIVYFSECGTRYILDCLRVLFEGGHRALEVRPDVHDAFNARVDAENALMAWGRSDVHSWYKNDRGRVTQNWPFTLLEYWQRTLEADPAEHVLLD